MDFVGQEFRQLSPSSTFSQIAEKFSNNRTPEPHWHFFAHITWYLMSQRLRLVATVDHSSYIYITFIYKLSISTLSLYMNWASSWHGRLGVANSSHDVSGLQDEDSLQTRGKLHGLLGPNLRDRIVSLLLYCIVQSRCKHSRIQGQVTQASLLNRSVKNKKPCYKTSQGKTCETVVNISQGC